VTKTEVSINLAVLKYPILVGRTIPQVEYCFLALSSMQAFDPVD
jgi:hypothetical protein